MRPEFLISTAVTPALHLLPSEMDTPQARVILMAIAYQESALQHRRQVRGPARGYWQFEEGGGVKGVLTHPASRKHIRGVLAALNYGSAPTPAACHAAVEHNDILAAAFARLLLWTDAEPLPLDEHGAWNLYLRTWRPGKPHPDKWAQNYQKAKEALNVLA